VAGVSRRAVTWTWDLDCSCKCQSLVLRITYWSLGIPSDVTLPPPLPLAPPARAPRCSPPPSLPPASPTRTTSSLWPLPSRHCFHRSPAWPSLAVAATTRRRCRYRPPPSPPGYRRPPGAAAASLFPFGRPHLLLSGTSSLPSCSRCPAVAAAGCRCHHRRPSAPSSPIAAMPPPSSHAPPADGRPRHISLPVLTSFLRGSRSPHHRRPAAVTPPLRLSLRRRQPSAADAFWLFPTPLTTHLSGWHWAVPRAA